MLHLGLYLYYFKTREIARELLRKWGCLVGARPGSCVRAGPGCATLKIKNYLFAGITAVGLLWARVFGRKVLDNLYVPFFETLIQEH